MFAPTAEWRFLSEVWLGGWLGNARVKMTAESGGTAEPYIRP